MFSTLAKKLDRCAIRAACGAPARGLARPEHSRELLERLQDAQYFSPPIERPERPRLEPDGHFSFPSSERSGCPSNDVVHGRIFKAGADWRKHPSVLLAHGWNAEACYRYQFPYLAWRLNRAGCNAVVFELPYHSQRRPTGEGVMRNFISDDLPAMLAAVRQSLADIGAIAAWIKSEGRPEMGIWGFSLGGWLAGLAICQSNVFDKAVLTTPIARMDEAIRDLDFCEPVRQALQHIPDAPLAPLDLSQHTPRLAPAQILLMVSRYDLFVSASSLEKLWLAWRKPEILRLNHGHISVLAAPWALERAVRWLVQSGDSKFKIED